MSIAIAIQFKYLSILMDILRERERERERETERDRERQREIMNRHSKSPLLVWDQGPALSARRLASSVRRLASM